MLEKQLNIIEFMEHPGILNDQTLSPAQRALLKSIYGLPLSNQELEIYQRSTGRTEEVHVEQRELTAMTGRQAGKSSKIGAGTVVYQAFRDHGLTRGNRAHAVLLAPTIRQAQIAMRYIREYLTSSLLLRPYIARIRRDEIELNNGVTIAAYPCSHIAVRGLSIISCICDEVAFWRHEETAASCEEEVLAAIRPGLAIFPKAKLIKISTPYRKEGILWREFQQRNELDHLVWQVSSAEMNPALPQAFLDAERKRSEEQFRREFLAEFTDQIAAWVIPEILDPCIIKGRTELPRAQKGTYAIAIDPAFTHSDFALAVLHRTLDGSIIVDRVEHWTGTKKAPVPFEWACQQIVRIANHYGVGEIIGDQFCFSVLKQYFGPLGLRYREHNFGSQTRLLLFSNLKHLLEQRKIELLDNPNLLRQLRALEQRAQRNGIVDTRPAHGQKDDLAVALALAAFELWNRPRPRRAWVEVLTLDREERGWTRIT